MKYILSVLLSLLFLTHLQAASSTSKWMKSSYKVNQVISGSHFAIDFNGITLVVKLAYLEPGDQAKAELSKMLAGKKVTIIPEPEAGLSKNGNQQVYAFVKVGTKRSFINQKLIESGASTYVKGKSKALKKLLTILENTSKEALSTQKAKEDMIKGTTLSEDQTLISELYSRKYYLSTCRWAKMMDPQSRIIYDSYEAAEKANKSPCSCCLYERLKIYRSIQVAAKKRANAESKTSEKPKGALFGIKSDNFFYSPVAKKLAQTPSSDIIEYKTLELAKKSGRKPDLSSLRINNPVVPAPKGKECIGRSLPYLRPCRAETTHSTGLCAACLNGRLN